MTIFIQLLLFYIIIFIQEKMSQISKSKDNLRTKFSIIKYIMFKNRI